MAARLDLAINHPIVHSPSGVRIHIFGSRHDDAVNAGYALRALEEVQPQVVCVELDPGMHKTARAVARHLAPTVMKILHIQEPSEAFTLISAAERLAWNCATSCIPWAATLNPLQLACGTLQYADILSALVWASDHGARVDSIDVPLLAKPGEAGMAQVCAAINAMGESQWACLAQVLRLSEEPGSPAADTLQLVMQWWDTTGISAPLSAAKAQACLVVNDLVHPKDAETWAALLRASHPEEYALVCDGRNAVMAQRLNAMCSRQGRYRSWSGVRSIVVVVGGNHAVGLRQQLSDASQ